MKGILLLCVVSAALLMQGCGGKEYVYHSDRDLKSGPGLFSGEKGEFTLLHRGPVKKDTPKTTDTPKATDSPKKIQDQ